MLSNIPRDKTQEELEKYLSDIFDFIQIEKIIYAYDIYDIVENIRQRQSLEDRIEYLERHKANQDPKSIENNETQVPSEENEKVRNIL